MEEDTLAGPSASHQIQDSGELPVTPDELLWDICSLAGQCKDLLEALANQDALPSGSDTESKKQLTGFNIWAIKIGAFRQGQQSMVYRLKGLPEMSAQFQRLLSSLRVILR